MRRPVLAGLGAVLVAFSPSEGAAAAGAIDYTRDVAPIFARACAKCHSDEKPKAGFRMTNALAIAKGGVSGVAVTPGHPEKSYLMQRLLGQGDEDRMPIEAKALTPQEIDIVRRWIEAGAHGPAEELSSFTAPPAGLRRLTARQYRAAVKDLLDLTTAVSLDPDDRSAQFSNIGGYKLTTSEGGSDLYRNAAFRLARAAFASPDRALSLVGCVPETYLDECGRRFIARFGRRAFRRPLAAVELARYGQVADRSARALNSGWLGLEFAVAAMLQSPKFLYLAETGTPDKGSHGARLQLDGSALASRLALFLWGTVPDEGLLDAADAGQLDSADGIRVAARRLLEAPAARDAFRIFLDEHLGLGGLQSLDKEPSIYKQSTSTIGPAMRGEIERLFDDRVFDRGGDILQLFETRETFVTPELAQLYGLEGFVSEGPEYRRVTLPSNGPRAGLLGLGGLLATTGFSTRTSPTLRGVFVRERILCEEVPDPPPNVKSDLGRPSEKRPKGLREQLALHASSPICANCHKFFDPIGLSLERFDTIGSYRESDAGSIISTAGKIDDQHYNGAPGLGSLLRKDPRTAACWVKSLYEYGAGHQTTAGDGPVLADLRQRFLTAGNDIKTLLVEIAASDGFRYVSRAPERLSFSRKAP